jgi:hypothetical protein
MVVTRAAPALLPPDFQPSNRDVICGRARENFHHGEQPRFVNREPMFPNAR